VPDLRPWATTAALTALAAAAVAQHLRSRADGEQLRNIRSIAIATNADIRALRAEINERERSDA
jgi:hypothetical protein